MPSQLASVPPISCSSTTDGPSPASSKWMLMPLASIQGTGFSSRRGGAHRGRGAGKIQHEVMPSPVAAAQASDIMHATCTRPQEWAGQATMASPRRIDVHFHLIPPFYREAVYAAGRGPAVGRYPEW